ncbi:hypothetical protein BT96DRAFT_315732 [Gymnopus androsaceus JB14]|uniref:Uncharacterized protein n=1 Tax=Gymnopus androsaceus JB14 TaxID=1447944 RepID=A0A6A4I4R1_9AGAR|nr:hypothetical protein BT96DRAFT_315732 [Gymnopus androsaceus JB14]
MKKFHCIPVPMQACFYLCDRVESTASPSHLASLSSYYLMTVCWSLLSLGAYMVSAACFRSGRSDSVVLVSWCS